MPRDFHIAKTGNDANCGSASEPLLTISEGAQRAEPGDTITVHAGTYRESVRPPRGGNSDSQRITYRAAPGEVAVIKGSEVVNGWRSEGRGVWSISLPNTFFGDFNPFADEIQGDWFNPKGRKHHTGSVYLNGEELPEAEFDYDVLNPSSAPSWHAKVNGQETMIAARFRCTNPNDETVEINVRKAIFYPEQPETNFITVQGFVMRHAATPWAPPTAEQVGLIGTHWSKGWIIENNEISHSRCVGITLGKYGDEWDNQSANTAEGYISTVQRALDKGWSKECIGHHIVRNNRISHCEQAGIVGSLGAAFSEISGNTIFEIHQRKAFDGAEQGAIKIHGAIDTVIRGNHIYRSHWGIWLDWMAQGTRATGNLCHDNDMDDLFLEVNHGPILIDNNVCLSRRSVWDRSEGTAFVHNLFAGTIWFWPELERETPYHKPHSTDLAGVAPILGGDDRFSHNLIVDAEGLASYDAAVQAVVLKGNVLLAEPPKVSHSHDGIRLGLTLPAGALTEPREIVTTEVLGSTILSQQAFAGSDGAQVRIDTDYFGNIRSEKNPFPGPFEFASPGEFSSLSTPIHQVSWT